jgi:hypothetical protein
MNNYIPFDPYSMPNAMKKKGKFMTAEEAKQALKDGKKVRCVKWRGYIESKVLIVDDCDDRVFGDVFEENENDEWEIVE